MQRTTVGARPSRMRLFLPVVFLLAVALGGCTGRDATSVYTGSPADVQAKGE